MTMPISALPAPDGPSADSAADLRWAVATPQARRAPLGPEEVRRRIAAAFVPAGAPSSAVGLELEWIVIDRSDPGRPVPGAEVLAAAGGPLPRRGTVGVEPGGQLELSTRPHREAAAALEAAAEDEAVLEARLAAAGLGLVHTGLDPFRPPVRSVDLPRYRAMEAAFDSDGPAGRLMMCSTASLQVNLDFGDDPVDTARRADLVGPVLAAAFANSPRRSATGAVLASARSAVWAAIDPTRTRPVPAGVDGWVAYALDARLLGGGPTDTAIPDGCRTLRDWVDGSGGPAAGDVDHHLSTLFPPVRPRRWLECRFLDALAPADRRVAVHALVALVGDGAPLDQLTDACGPAGGAWERVPVGTADPVLQAGAERCLALAADLLDETGVPAAAAEVRTWAAGRAGQSWRPPPPDGDLPSLDPSELETP